jgi:hypothetical protein
MSKALAGIRPYIPLEEEEDDKEDDEESEDQ